MQIRLIFVFLGLLPLAGAGENALLKSGFSIRAERAEKAGEVYRFHTKEGVIEVAASEVVLVEADDFVPVAAPAPAAVMAAQANPEVKAGPVALAAAKPSIPDLINRAAARAGLPPELIHSVAKAESNYQPAAISPKGAIGVMQLMPATAAALDANPHDPEQNIEAGARYLRDLLIKYDGDSVKALAAYNAGPAAVDRYQGVPPYRETVTYVDRVLRNYQRLTAAGGRATP